MHLNATIVFRNNSLGRSYLYPYQTVLQGTAYKLQSVSQTDFNFSCRSENGITEKPIHM